MGQQLGQARPQRVGPPMFPDSMDEGLSIASGKLLPDQVTAAQQMAESSQTLKQAVVSLMNYQVWCILTVEYLVSYDIFLVIFCMVKNCH